MLRAGTIRRRNFRKCFFSEGDESDESVGLIVSRQPKDDAAGV